MSGSIQNKRVKIKMLVLLLITSFIVTIPVSGAVAEACSAESPCGTWAVVDNSGTVTNVIVCQASVCGSGTLGGQRVVPQIAANPVTNYSQGSFIGNESAGIRVTESNGVFTVHENVRTYSSETAVTVDIQTETTITTISEVSVPVTSRSFSYEDTIGKTYTEIKLKNESYDDSKPTNILVTKETSNSLSSESISIVGRKTASELDILFVQNEKNLLLSKINVLLRLLGSWVK